MDIERGSGRVGKLAGGGGLGQRSDWVVVWGLGKEGTLYTQEYRRNSD